MRQHGPGVLNSLRRDERGAVAIMVALAFVAVMALILLAVQVGDIGMVRGMLQGSADQAALAGAASLDGTDDGVEEAREQAEQMVNGGRNFVSSVNEGKDLSIAGDAFETGIWDLEHPENGFTPSTDAEEVNAVRVVGRKTRGANGQVPMFLGGFLGPDSVGVARQAIAAIGSCREVPCHPDIPIAACQEDLRCGQKIRLLQSDNTSDNSAWTGFDQGASASTVRGMIKDCKKIPDVSTGDTISLTNGQDNSANQELLDQLEEYKKANPCPNIKKPDNDTLSCDDDCKPPYTGPALDIDGDGKVDKKDCGLPVIMPLISCANGRNLNGPRPMTGFVLMVITDVEPQKSPKYVEVIPLCGIHIPGATTGPGPACDESTPVCCSTIPVLVNKDL
jgi:hypothetical protein